MYAKKEWFLSILILLYLALSIVDPFLPSRSLGLIDYESLAIIVSLFIVSRGLELSGIFGRVAHRIVRFSGGSEFKLLSIVMLIVSFSSAVIMNDTAMFVFVPLVLTISRITKINLPKAVTLVALAANIGSALTPIGNPQNIILWRMYRISLWEFVRSMSPYVLLWIVLLLTFIWIGSRGKSLEIFSMPKIRINRSLMLASTLLLIVNIILAEGGFSPVGLALTIFITAIVSKEALFSLDVALVAVFALVFIDFRELSLLLLSSNVVLQMSAAKIIILSVGLSQLISNVPSTVMLTSANFPWLPLAIGVNLGGIGLIIGSLANFIALRISGIGLKSFHRYSLPYFLTALLITLLIFSY